LTREQRSFNMSMIKGSNTKPELALRKALYANKVRGYRIHPAITGKPDIVFRKKKLAVFVDGCFWHKCPKCFTKPVTNKTFWVKKIESNITRAKIVNASLKKEGWTVIRIWEHEIRKNLNKCSLRILSRID